MTKRYSRARVAKQLDNLATNVGEDPKMAMVAAVIESVCILIADGREITLLDAIDEILEPDLGVSIMTRIHASDN